MNALSIVRLIVGGLETLLKVLLEIKPELANEVVIQDLIKVLDTLKALDL